MATRRLSSGLILLGIVALVVLAVLIAPAEQDEGGSYSTLSAAQTGARIVYDLTGRLGWSPERRDVEFDKDKRPAPVQVLIGVSIGAAETHALLDFVRAGGSLLVADVGSGLGDSLHLTDGPPGLIDRSRGCRAGDPFEMVLEVPRPTASLRWRRPPPSDTTGFGLIETLKGGMRVRPAYGFTLGAGRVVAVAGPEPLANDVVRICANEADVAYVRMIEFLTDGRHRERVAFDEFHHGSGVHGGSLAAIRQYIVAAPSGRMLGQIAFAGLLLLMAAAPRPLAPRDPERIARRSPLEHADALARAYMAVGATRTATARLLSGVRRRTRRNRARESDEQLLANAATTSPDATTAVRTVENALKTAVPNRDLPAVAAAIGRVEHALVSRPPLRKP